MDAVAAVKVAFAALRFFDGAALNRDGNIFAAADAVAVAATHGLLDGAARDGDIGIAAVVTAADAGTIVAALGFYGAAGDVDGGSAGGVRAAADACAALLGLRLDFGSAADGDIGFAGSIATAANAGTIGGAFGGDVAACYLNVAGATVAIVAGVPDAADASRGTTACGSQAAGVAAIRICFGCDGQSAGVAAIIILLVVLEAGMLAVAGEGIVALERDRRVARALDAEGGVVVGLNVDILQRHVEGAAFGLVDDADDVVGDVFGCVPEVFRSTLQGRGRFVPGLFVVIGVGDIDGCAGVRELASQHRAVAGLGLFRGISLVFLAAGGAAGLVLVFLAGGVVAGLVLVFLAAGGAAGLVLVFLAAGGAAGLVLVFLVAGGAAGLVLVFLVAGGVAGLVLVFLAAGGGVAGLVLVFLVAGGVVGLVLVFLAAGGAAGLVLVFLAAGGAAGLVLVFLAAGGVVGLVLVFLAAALGVAEVDHVIVFAVF